MSFSASTLGTTYANLSVLHLTNNLLVGVGERAFVSAPQLRELYLRRNQLRSLHASSFSDLPILEVLDLSCNQLTVLPPDLLSQILSIELKTLVLEDNQITVMPDNWFSSKPELPYVFLSKNPWACFCKVGYLQVYLDNQAHNVYILTNPDGANPIQDLENNVDTVVCASPLSLANRPIIELTEDEYCDLTLPSEAPVPAVGFGDTYASVGIPSHTQPLTSTTVNPWTTRTTTRITTAPAPTTIDLGTTSSLTTISNTQITSAVDQRTIVSLTTVTSATTDTTFQHVFTTPVSILASTLRGTIMLWTRRWMERWTESWTFDHAWTESLMSSSNRSSSWSIFTTSYPITHPELTTPTWPTTLLPDASTSNEGPTATTTTTLSVTADSTITKTDQPPIIDWSHGHAGSRIWCTWLFAGLLLLCLLSALSSCLLALGLMWIYFTLYKPLVKGLANGTDADTHLLDYHVKSNSYELEGYGIGLAPMDSSGGVQATFRSVLFIAKGSEGEEVEEKEKGKETDENEKGGEDEKQKEHREGYKAGAASFAGTELGITNVGTGVAVVKRRNQKEGEMRSGVESKEVFRKTLYRVFSREEEIEGWREVEEHWEGECGTKEGGERKDSRKRISVVGRTGVERKTRYSLILREEKTEGECGAQEMGLEWLVGAWEMGGIGGGMNEEGWASLISGMREERPTAKPPSPKEDV